MKLSAAAVLVSISSASAFSVSYLNQLSTGGASATRGTGLTNYLDAISGADSVPALVTALEQAAPAAPAAQAPMASSAAPTSKDYLSALSGTTVSRSSGAGITTYLDAIPKVANAPRGAGLTGYLDALPKQAAVSGSGMRGYLDGMGGSAPVKVAAPAVAAAPAAPVAAAAAPAAPAAKVAVAASGLTSSGYLGSLGGGSSPTGAGLTGYLSTLPTNDSARGGPGLQSYVGTLAVNAAGTSGAGLTGYLDALKTNSVISGANQSGLTSFLANIYSQIMSLPAEQRSVSGKGMTFASADGKYAMSFAALN